MAEYSTELAQAPKVSYLTQDHLGSPRVITDEDGEVVSRHDYLAYGEELTQQLGAVGGRSSGQGYGAADEIRKKYTGYERDDESGLDYAKARYYDSFRGRYTSVDPLTASADVKNPQTFNRYTYVLNSPYKFTDPLGLISKNTGANGGTAWCATCKTTDGPGGFSEPIILVAIDVTSPSRSTGGAEQTEDSLHFDVGSPETKNKAWYFYSCATGRLVGTSCVKGSLIDYFRGTFRISKATTYRFNDTATKILNRLFRLVAENLARIDWINREKLLRQSSGSFEPFVIKSPASGIGDLSGAISKLSGEIADARNAAYEALGGEGVYLEYMYENKVEGVRKLNDENITRDYQVYNRVYEEHFWVHFDMRKRAIDFVVETAGEWADAHDSTP